VHRGAVLWTGEACYASSVELEEAIARLAAEPARPCGRLVVRLERPPVQIRTLHDLPPVKAKELTALVAHQAGRFFRRNGEPLVADAVWIRNGGTRVARGAAVPEPLVEAIASGARAAGLRLDQIAPVEEGLPLCLLPTSERVAREGRRRLHTRRLALLATATWMVVVAVFVARLIGERRAVERELARLDHSLATVLVARRELRAARAATAAVAQTERERGRSLAFLAAVTRALPDSAVATAVVWSADGHGILTGVSRRAAEVVARLERSGSVAAPRLDGPVVRETVAGREWERFTVVFGEGKQGKAEGA